MFCKTSLQIKVLNSDCGPPENVTNGKGDVSTPGGTVYLQVATYTCIPSFVAMGNTQRTCQPNGMWSGSAPYCGAFHFHLKSVQLNHNIDMPQHIVENICKPYLPG